ncbi:structural maintenance of chromosome domain-containing protein [Cyclospora cayetanensis]|uniref:Structural maintenance of chromosome domain-containing protein n=1 Tax=Cyclospora cayetanensis TaxID=88456 RepID=A0A1D3CZC8_9EIME|nr:structural maintenance of chromosome domain-containing protein [Cyclospora cayetanensis]
MHIKAITLQGFKTYNDATTIVFSEGCTCLIGHNGSGKSNILLGISFALGDIGNSAAERRLLLHEGLQGRVSSGFVELILNNADRRLCMLDSDQVVIRRSFSLNSDDVAVQGKPVSKGELEQLIECAGLSGGSLRSSRRSGSTSSFLIRQGRIQEVALLSAAGRLRLLLSAGPGAFLEAKANETEQVLQQAATERQAVQKGLKDLQTQLEAMDSDREELRACLDLERQKAAIEAALHEADWNDAAESLRKAEEQQAVSKGPLNGSRCCEVALRRHRATVRSLAAAAAEAEAARDEAAAQLANLSAQHSAHAAKRIEADNAAVELQGEETRFRLESEVVAEQAAAQEARAAKTRHALEEKQREVHRLGIMPAHRINAAHAQAADLVAAAEQTCLTPCNPPKVPLSAAAPSLARRAHLSGMRFGAFFAAEKEIQEKLRPQHAAAVSAYRNAQQEHMQRLLLAAAKTALRAFWLSFCPPFCAGGGLKRRLKGCDVVAAEVAFRTFSDATWTASRKSPMSLRISEESVHTSVICIITQRLRFIRLPLLHTKLRLYIQHW